MICLLAPAWLSPTHLSCHDSGGAHVWPPKGPRSASSLENTARAPSSALSQRTKNANTRAAGERAMRPLQALAGQKAAERQCSSSGRGKGGKGLAIAWGHLPAGSSLALLPNRPHASPAFCSREVSFALSLNSPGREIGKWVRSGAVRSPFACVSCTNYSLQ